MPVIKSAKKKLRQDKKRTVERAKQENALKDAVKKATVSPSSKTLSQATSLVDKAAKKHIIHKNKAARIKSRLALILNPKKKEQKMENTEHKKSTKKVTPKAEKKPATKKPAKTPKKK